MSQLDLEDLTPEQIAPLEQLIEPFPPTWQDLARCHYVTLLGRELGREAEAAPARLPALAQLSVELVLGVARGMGGGQHYIPIGVELEADARALRVVQAWRAGQPWVAIAAAERITERRVRQIVSAWQIETFGRAQLSLPLDEA